MHALEAAAFAAEDSTQDFAGALLAGLHAQPKRVPCKFLYDAEGSALFERICELPEYYPTRTEMALLGEHAAEFARYMGPDVELIEFGAGSGRKASMLLDVLERPRLYMPIDISPDAVAAAAGTVWHAFPHLKVVPLEADYTGPLALGPQRGQRRVGFFPGSTIGNFPPDEALAFLRRLAELLRGGGLLIGVDLVKDPAVLHAAYNDAAGVTAAFNRNLLARANRELEADFLLDRFAHYAFYQPVARRVEMHLVSLVQQQVHVRGQTISFAAGETLHTEDSYKYSVLGFHSLAAQAGFLPRATRVDPQHRFSLHWLEVPA
ncbi:L-histidine N(alpha)-methyltransferase [Azoarcus sp. TTM-91]|uniref:L-histidine N(alpha)-methyltransferase n=1 Tax=Azoarcus sp. TTM-91 TaxID=2691581 RepID=UPI00145C4F3B|nr:L-histidine N(alpha)-methyltransferase [Azoarcus sp. TTM-91]NMG36205.1 L-histidine N(alpha)-methyltransferase [Azoarcus sp. TTM-91]